MRLGFPVHVFGCRDLPAYDARPWYQRANLSVSLVRLYDLLRYLRANDLHMYRLHSGLLPRGLEGKLAREQMAACMAQIRLLGDLAKSADIRLSFHAANYAVLNSPDEDRAKEPCDHLAACASLLEALDQGPEAVIVVHVGGIYDHVQGALDRFCQRHDALAPGVRRRLALEQDDRRFSYAHVRQVHERCGIPLVFDSLHHHVLNPEGIPLPEALAGCLDTWPDGVTPKVHFSSPRTELRRKGVTAPAEPPRWTEHSDLANPFEFIAFVEGAPGRHFDVMLEARARDLAVLRLREDLRRFAPSLAEGIV